MAERVVVLTGHPDGGEGHFCGALADAYARGAEAAGASVTRLDLAGLAPEPLASAAEFATEPAGAMETARAAIGEADHIVVVFPLWMGGMPARLKAFFEQMARADFAIAQVDCGWPEQRLKGKSARVIVTMGMPALAYRIWFLNSGVAVLTRMILGMAGVSPLRQTTIGGVDAIGDAKRRRWLERVEGLGRRLR